MKSLMATKWVEDLVLISVKLKNVFCGGQGESIATSVAEYLTVLFKKKGTFTGNGQ